MNNNQGHLSFLISKTSDTLKSYYEYIIPFGILYLISSVIVSMIPNVYLAYMIQILVLPLGYSIQYFLSRIERDEVPRFELFFRVYQKIVPILISKVVVLVIVLICLLPAFKTVYDLLALYNFDPEQLNQAIINQELEIPTQAALAIMASGLIIFFTIPFYFFFEYFLIFNDRIEVFKSLRKAYQIGYNHYFSIIGILFVSLAAIFIGALTCGFGLIVAIPYMYTISFHAYQYFNSIEFYKELEA